MKQTLAKFIARLYLRYDRGNTLLSVGITIAKNVVYAGALAYLIQNWFGITVTKSWLISAAFGYTGLCYCIGYMDELWGFWRHQNSYSAMELNPFWKEMAEDIKEIKARL